MSEFTSVPSKKFNSKRKSVVVDHTTNTAGNLTKLVEKFNNRLLVIKNSQIYKDIKEYIDEYLHESKLKWENIRCLALGSPCSENQALYQLCLLQLLSEEYKIENVSLWDPVFNKLDERFLQDHLNFEVSESYDFNLKESNTLYYMPHSPISLLEAIVKSEAPCWMLANDLTIYNHKYTKTEYFEQYPYCSRIANLVDSKQLPKERDSPQAVDDGFEPVKSKRSQRKRKNRFVEPVVVYDYESCYFNHLTYRLFQNGNDSSQPWEYSFSDLSFNVLTKRL